MYSLRSKRRKWDLDDKGGLVRPELDLPPQPHSEKEVEEAAQLARRKAAEISALLSASSSFSNSTIINDIMQFDAPPKKDYFQEVPIFSEIPPSKELISPSLPPKEHFEEFPPPPPSSHTKIDYFADPPSKSFSRPPLPPLPSEAQPPAATTASDNEKYLTAKVRVSFVFYFNPTFL